MSRPIILHRYGLFRADGTAIGYSARALVGSDILRVGGRTIWGKEMIPTYHAPMDDDSDDWRRLVAEWQIKIDPSDPALIDLHGHPEGLRHTGWSPHPLPLYAHVRLGGVFVWGHDPHPRVQAHMRLTAGMDDAALIRHLCGEDALP